MTDSGGGSVAKDVWGPSLWSAMHSLSFTFPAACDTNCGERAAMFEFLKSLKTLIPCQECRGHYSKWFDEKVGTKASTVLSGRDALSKSLVDLHNEVNKREEKKAIDYDAVVKKYVTSQKSCKVNFSNADVQSIVLVTIIAIVSIALIATTIHNIKKKKN